MQVCRLSAHSEQAANKHSFNFTDEKKYNGTHTAYQAALCIEREID
jgi:hypothetical protein